MAKIVVVSRYILICALFTFAYAGLLFTGCATTPPEEIESEPEIHTPEPVPEEEIEDALIEAEKIEPEEPEPPEEYEMDEEEYAETMEDLTGLIQTLNTIISRRDYQTWLSYLTDDYIEHFSDPEVLHEQSQTPMLRNHDIVLRNLRDYFNYVVVASRQAVRLDDIAAIDENRVRAYMLINNQPTIIYTLVRTDEGWRVGR